jgi:hypothetical protein
MELVDSMPRLKVDLKGKGKEEAEADDEYTAWIDKLGQGGERIRTVKSMQKKALQGYGGRDTSAQLFVSLCRAMGLGARLVTSLQPVNWRADKHTTPNKKVTLNKEDATEVLRVQREQEEAASPKKPPVSQLVKEAAAAVQASKSRGSPRKVRRKGKLIAKTHSEEEDDDEMEEVVVQTPIKDDDEIQYLGSSEGQRLDGAPVVKLKKHMDELYRLKAPKPQRFGAGTSSRPKKKAKAVGEQYMYGAGPLLKLKFECRPHFPATGFLGRGVQST